MRFPVLWVICGCIAACGDQTFESLPASLVATVAEPPGANCAAGGEAIESGVDHNANGVLDASEITATSYVCAGVGGSVTLVGVVVEPPGAHCANGGQAIETGFDTNGNGVLDPSEVSQTSYVCAGTNGQESLIRIDPEQAGAHCSTGGSAIHIGIDTNDDAMLEDSEIQSTTYVCHPTNPTIIDGSFIVSNSVDAAQLVGVTTITGDLTINAVGLTSIDLSSLQTVEGALTFTTFSGTTLAMPALTSAGSISFSGTTMPVALELPVLTTTGYLYLGGYGFAAMTFPALTTISESLFVSYSNVLATLSLPVLTTVQSITVTNCPMITSLDFRHVTTTSDVQITNDTNLASLSLHVTSVHALVLLHDPALTALDLSSLTTVGDRLDLEYLTALESLDLSSLTSIGGPLYFSRNDALDTLAFPALTSVASTIAQGVPVQINFNATLTSLTAPVWTSFGALPGTNAVQIYVNDCPLLANCELQALADQVGSFSPFFSNNDFSATCP
jgi:hypothetical protein